LLADPRFVLEPDPDLPIRVPLADPLDKKGASSSHCFIAAGALSVCWGRGRKQLRPRRCSNA